jgi:serine/threonine-protein kinase RsbW
MSRDRAPAPGHQRPGERAEFVLEIPSDLRVIEAAVAYVAERLRSHSFRGSRLDLNFRVGLTEALANAILYGNRGDPSKSIRVEVALEESHISLSVIDEGNGFDPDSVPDPTLPENLERPGGRGLFLLRELMDEVEYNARGNAVRLVLLRDPQRRRSSSLQ